MADRNFDETKNRIIAEQVADAVDKAQQREIELRSTALMISATRRGGLSEVRAHQITENTIADAEVYLRWLKGES